MQEKFNLKEFLGDKPPMPLQELVQGAWEIHKLSNFLEAARKKGGTIVIPDEHFVTLIKTISGLIDNFTAALVVERDAQGKDLTVYLDPDMNNLPIKYEVQQVPSENTECLN